MLDDSWSKQIHTSSKDVLLKNRCNLSQFDALPSTFRVSWKKKTYGYIQEVTMSILRICHWTTQSPQNGGVFPTPRFDPTKLWERPIANTPRSSGRKLIGFKQRVHSLDLPHGNWNHPGWPIFFSLNVPNEKPQKHGDMGPLFLIQVGNQTRDVKCKPTQPITTYESVCKNIWVYTLYNWTQECIDRCQHMLWHKWNKQTNYGGNAIDLDHSRSISFTMCQVDGLVNQA